MPQVTNVKKIEHAVTMDDSLSRRAQRGELVGKICQISDF